MIEILGVDSGGARATERVVRDRDGRRVGRAVSRDGDLYVELAPDAPAAVRSVLAGGDGASPVRLESRFVAEAGNGEIRLRL